MSFFDFLMTVALPALVGGGSALALLKFLGERMIGHQLSKDLETYKVELSERTDVLKAQLAIFAHEQNIVTSRVDTQRANAIHKVYSCMRQIINPTSSIVAGTPIINGTAEQSARFYRENAEAAHAACGKLSNTLSDLAIYFDNETYMEIAHYSKAAMTATGSYLHHLRKCEAEGGSHEELLAIAESQREELRRHHNESMLPQAKKLTKVFRILLGIEKTNSAV